jgi:hypothetical protein
MLDDSVVLRESRFVELACVPVRCGRFECVGRDVSVCSAILVEWDASLLGECGG